MAYANAAITEFKDGSTPSTGTLALGSLFEAEFDQLYGNWNHFFGAAGTTLTVDNITEKVVDAGVTIEGITLVDGYVDGVLPINTTAVKGIGGVVHIANGTNADTNWITNAPLVVETNTNCYMNIRTPNSLDGGVLFTDPDTNFSGGIAYNHADNFMRFYISASERMRLNATGLYIGGPANSSNLLHIQGTTTPQFRIAYDGSNYNTIQTNSSGHLLIASTSNVTRFLSGALTDWLDSSGSNYFRIYHDGTNAFLFANTGTVQFANTTDSTSKDTGALIVEGGVGIEKNLSIGGDLQDASGNPVAGWLDDGTPYYKKVINIGDWNMDTTASVDVAHGLTLANIRTVQATIRSDSASEIIVLGHDYTSLGNNPGDAYILTIDSTNVTLSRANGGAFDNATFDSTSYNRGWIIIEYV